MPNVRRTIRHILKHVNAEAADSDPTQTAGVQARAQLARDSVASLVGDERDITLRALMIEIHDNIPNGQGRKSFRRAMVHMRDAGERPRHAIQFWVQRQREDATPEAE